MIEHRQRLKGTIPLMRARVRRRIALLLFAVLAFAQLNGAFAAPCPMSAAMSMDLPCDDCDTPLQSAHNDMPSVCATACATSEQPGAVTPALVLPPLAQPVLLLLKPAPLDQRATGLAGPPSGAPPHRILLHSFLI